MTGREKGLLAVAGFGALLGLKALRRKARRWDMSGKVVLITGGSRGLGLLLARLLADEGAKLALCARNMEELERAECELRERTNEVFTCVCDVTDRDQVEAMLRQVREHYGYIDVLVNNAGVIEVGPMETMTEEDYEEAMNVHFWGPLYTTLAVLPEMRRMRKGRIVNIASIGGKVSIPHLLPYSASKFALVGFSEGLRAELAKEGILVTTVCPGLMRTGSHENAVFKGNHRAEYTAFSLIGALPVSSMDAAKAARQILRALRYGDAEVVLS